MKKAILVALVCINVGLVLALVFGANTPQAKAQGFGAGGNYIAATGQYGEGQEILYVVDLDAGRMIAWHYNQTGKRLSVVGTRELKRDFR